MENILKSVKSSKSDKYHLKVFSNIISDFSQIQRDQLSQSPSKLVVILRCDTPELDWSGGEDEEGRLWNSQTFSSRHFENLGGSSSKLFETNSPLNTSNIIELRLETERLASMVSLFNRFDSCKPTICLDGQRL